MDLQANKTDGKVLPLSNRRISAAEWNQLAASCMAFITAAGLTPDALDNEQLLNAFKAIVADLELVGANTNLSNLTDYGQAKFDAKANTALSNISSAAKQTIVALSMPEYDTGVAFNANTAVQAPYDCVVCWNCGAGTNNPAYFAISKTGAFAGEELKFPWYINSDGYTTLQYFVPKGWYFKTSRNNDNAAFSPSQYFKLKGAS